MRAFSHHSLACAQQRKAGESSGHFCGKGAEVRATYATLGTQSIMCSAQKAAIEGQWRCVEPYENPSVAK